jgi:hypothetical protein
MNLISKKAKQGWKERNNGQSRCQCRSSTCRTSRLSLLFPSPCPGPSPGSGGWQWLPAVGVRCLRWPVLPADDVRVVGVAQVRVAIALDRGALVVAA